MSQTSDSESSQSTSQSFTNLSSCETVASEPEIPEYPLEVVNVRENEVAFALAKEGFFINEERLPLSNTHRGTTTVLKDVHGQRFVCRVSKYVRPERRSNTSLRGHLRKSGDRILRFGEYWYSRQNEIHSLVPILTQPQIVDDSWLVEKYKEIGVTSDEGFRRMDLHKFCTGTLPPCFDKDLRTPLAVGYLLDIVHTVADLHDHGWVHLDISLENIAISNTQGYLIDFESSLQFSQVSKGFIQMGHIKVPLKLPFVPPENFKASKSDLVCLPTYDVWSLGCMLFAVLFRRYPFSFSSREEGQQPNARELRYFNRHGLKRFLKKYHRSAFNTLKAGEEEWIVHARDLLNRVFVSATAVRAKVVRYDVEERFTARQMFEHPFWNSYGCKTH